MDGGPAPEAIQDRRAGLKAKRFGEVGEENTGSIPDRMSP
jgi:hypothetical protein